MDMLPQDYPGFAGRPDRSLPAERTSPSRTRTAFLVVGARLDMPQIAFSHANFARAAKKIIVDVDPLEMGKFEMTIDVPIVADASDFLSALINQASASTFHDSTEWTAKTKEWSSKYPVILPEYWQQKNLVDLYVLSMCYRISAPQRTSSLLAAPAHAATSSSSASAFKVASASSTPLRSAPWEPASPAPLAHASLPAAPHHLREWRRRIPAQHSGSRDRAPAQSTHQVLHPLQRHLRLHHGHPAQLLRRPDGRQRSIQSSDPARCPPSRPGLWHRELRNS